MNNIFSKIVSLNRKSREAKRWYLKRKLQQSYYDTDEKKWVFLEKYPAIDILADSWEGESNIIEIMLLKVEQMIVNLRKYGVEADNYVYPNVFFDEEATDSDRAWAYDYINKKYFVNLKKTLSKGSPGYNFKVNKAPNNKNEWEVELFIGSFISKENKDFVESYSLVVQKGDNTTYRVIGKKLPRRFDCVKEPAPFFDKNIIKLSNLDDFQKFLDENNISINIRKSLISNEQVFNISVEDYKYLSDHVKNTRQGNRCKIIQLLELRRLLKRVRNISDTDDEFSSWMNVDEEHRSEALSQCYDKYRQKRLDIYNKIALLMATKGDRWWD